MKVNKNNDFLAMSIFRGRFFKVTPMPGFMTKYLFYLEI